MKFKYWKPIVLVISSVLLFIEVVILIYDINDGKIEWGNVSDWLSSLSTFGTLLIAYAAFVKAPDWLFQKRYEVVSHIINETIFNDLPKLGKLCSQYKTRYYMITRQLVDSLNGKVMNEQMLKENRTKLDNTFNELFALATSMKNELRTIKRNEFEFTEYTARIYNEVTQIASNFNSIDSEIFFSTLDAIDFDLSDETDPQKYLDTLMSLKVRTIHLSNSFNEFARQIDDDNKPVEEFIIPFKK